MQAPQNEWNQRRLMVLLQRQGDGALRQQGDSTTALTAYHEALAIAKTLAARDPANTQWQRDLLISRSKISGLLDQTKAAYA